jgi:protein ImuA
MEKAIPKSRLHIREKCDIEQIMNNKAILSGSLPSLSRGMWQQYQPDKQQALLPMGVPWVDARLHGGIARHALHEFFGAAKADVTAAAAFALLLALRLPEPQLRIFWISGDKERRASGRLYPPGLAEMGGDPARMLLVQAADLRDALRAAADSIRSKAAGAVILEAQGNARLIDLTSTRRLALAAAEAGVLALLVRGDAVPMPSAATTRWQVRSAPSLPLPGNAPGFATFDISLLRHRGGTAPFGARVAWNHATRSFHDAPLSGGLSAAVTGGKTDPDARLHA